MADDGRPQPPPDVDGREGRAAHALPGSMVWPRRLGLLTIALASMAVLAALFRTWLASPLPSGEFDVAQQWFETINRLGIEPVYPPQEDFSVGDILLFVTEDRLTGKLPPSITNRSLKLWHVDVTEALEDSYKDLYHFPDTLPRPKADDDIWKQQASDRSIFQIGLRRRHLPIVLFPGVTLARVRQASAGSSWSFNPLTLVGAAEGEAEQTVELRIPSAESYGLPNITATVFLDRFCKNPETRFWCTEVGARRQLSMLKGSEIFEVIDRAEHPLRGQYRFGVEVLFVSRVYLSRSIQSITQSRSVLGAQATLAARLSQEVQRLEAAGPATASAAQTPESTETNVALQRVVADQKARLNALISELSGLAPGGAVSIRAADQSRIAVTQNLQRPVVIGMRAARRTLFEK